MTYEPYELALSDLEADIAQRGLFKGRARIKYMAYMFKFYSLNRDVLYLPYFSRNASANSSSFKTTLPSPILKPSSVTVGTSS